MSRLTDLLIKAGIAAVDPEPEPANPRWAEALLTQDPKGTNR